MFLDKYEIDEIDKAKKFPVNKAEAREPITFHRLVNIARGLAQKAMAYPNTYETIINAERDNDLISKNQSSIQNYEDYLSDESNTSARNMFMLDRFDEQIKEHINEKRNEINQIRGARRTPEDIDRKQSVSIDYKIGGFIKLKWQ